MTTAQSPLRALKAQADSIAKTIKAAARGEPIDPGFARKLAEAKGRDAFVVGIVMDDKILQVTIQWSAIHDTSEVALAAYILKHMRESREH